MLNKKQQAQRKNQLSQDSQPIKAS